MSISREPTSAQTGAQSADSAACAERENDFDRHLPALDLAKSREETLIAQWQKLRNPLTSLGSMLRLMELGHKLTSVRPLHEIPSDFDEGALQQVRRDFHRLVCYFNELATLTGQSPVQIDNHPPSGEKTHAVASNRSANGES